MAPSNGGIGAMVVAPPTMGGPKRDEMLERAPLARTVPQIFIGAVHVGGSDELHALEREGKLDALLAG